MNFIINTILKIGNITLLKKQIRHSTYDSQQGIVYEGCDVLPEGMSLPKDNYTEIPMVI